MSNYYIFVMSIYSFRRGFGGLPPTSEFATTKWA